MVYAIRHLWFLLILSLLSACATMRNFPIETLQPAKLTFEGPKKNIAVCASQTLFAEAVMSNLNATSVPVDSLITNILYSLQTSWKETPGYEDTQFFLYILKTDELPGASNFDLVVWLDNLQVKNTYYGQQYSYYDWEAYLHVLYTARWVVRDKSGKTLDEYSDRDLIVWPSGIRQSKSEAVADLPDIKDAWWDMGITLAKSYAVRILPKWQTGVRNIYMINKFPELSQQAYTAMQRNGYGRAFDIWENMLLSCRKRGQKNMKSRITYNMAIACEFQNQLEEAVYWAKRSTAFSEKTATANYLKLLQERLQQRVQLDQQTGNRIIESLNH